MTNTWPRALYPRNDDRMYSEDFLEELFGRQSTGLSLEEQWMIATGNKRGAYKLREVLPDNSAAYYEYFQTEILTLPYAKIACVRTSVGVDINELTLPSNSNPDLSGPEPQGLTTFPIDYQAMYSILARYVNVAADHIKYEYGTLELESAMKLIEEVETLQRMVIDTNWKKPEIV